MLDAFGIGSGTKKAQKLPPTTFSSSSTRRREERSALSEMLTQVTMRASKLAQTHKTLEQVEKTAAGTLGKVDELGRRLTSLDERTKAMEDVDKKIKNLRRDRPPGAAGGRARRRTRRRPAEASRSGEAALIADARDAGQPRHAEERARVARRAANAAAADAGRSQAVARFRQPLKTELEQVRAAATILGQDYARIREMSREAREDSGAAMEAVKDVEKRMGPLAQLHELSKNTEERLASLNALAEHVTHKAKALESQKHTIDHAVVEANRLNEMVWSMDSQIAKLNEGNKQIARDRREPRAHGEAGRRDRRASSTRPPRRRTSSRARWRASRRTATR